MSGQAGASALESALAAAGIAASVEARERLALIRPRGAAAARAIAVQRERVTTLATAHGFSHAALEIVSLPDRDAAAPSDAALPGD